MPSPPINVNSTLTIPAQRQVWNGPILLGSDPETATLRKEYRYRPEGVNTPKPAPGYKRDLTEWQVTDRRLTTAAQTFQHGFTFYPAGWTIVYTNGSGYVVGHPPFETAPSSLRGRAINGALAKLLDQNVNLSVAFGEVDETARFIGNNIGRITDLYRDLKRGGRGVWDYVKNFRSNPRDTRISQIPKAWLEVQYAAKPLLNEALGAAASLEKAYGTGDSFSVTVRASPKEDSRTTRASPEFCNLLGVMPLVCDVETVHRGECVLSYAMGNPFTQALSSLGLANPLSTAYELSRFSFVLDWALPLGDWLSALGADTGWDFLQGSYTYTQRLNYTGQNYSAVFPPYTNPGGGDLSLIQSRNFAMAREVFYSSPSPVYPELRNPLSSAYRVGSALALLHEVMYD